jgi:hypothetical protein
MFELDRRDVTERFAQPCVVTPADVSYDGELMLGEDGRRLDRYPVWMSRLAAGPRR